MYSVVAHSDGPALTCMGCELLQHRSIEKVAIIYAVFEVSEIAHPILAVHKNSVRPKTDTDVNDPLQVNSSVLVADNNINLALNVSALLDSLHAFSLFGVTGQEPGRT